jgi:predicted dehydrogenase
MTRTARVGYVGVDHHHRDPYLGATKRLPVEVVACCEPDRSYTAADVRTHVDRPDEIPAEGVDVGRVVEGATFYEDPETMLDDAELDVLWVTYRNDAVPGIVDAAVEAGVDVLSEKPVARTAADLEPVAERAAAAGVTVGATYFYRYNPVVKALKRRVEAGLFGDVWSVEGRYVGSKLEYRDTDHYLYDDTVSRGGALQWVGLHWVDLFGYVLDDPIAAVCARSTPTSTSRRG